MFRSLVALRTPHASIRPTARPSTISLTSQSINRYIIRPTSTRQLSTTIRLSSIFRSINQIKQYSTDCSRLPAQYITPPTNNSSSFSKLEVVLLAGVAVAVLSGSIWSLRSRLDEWNETSQGPFPSISAVSPSLPSNSRHYVQIQQGDPHMPALTAPTSRRFIAFICDLPVWLFVLKATELASFMLPLSIQPAG